MKNVIIKCLSRLASEAYQNHYMLHGTKDSYTTIDDLMNDALGTAETILYNQTDKQSFLEKEIKALENFLTNSDQSDEEWDRLDQMEYEELLISPEWKTIVSGAQECLLELGVEPGAWDAIAFES